MESKNKMINLNDVFDFNEVGEEKVGFETLGIKLYNYDDKEYEYKEYFDMSDVLRLRIHNKGWLIIKSSEIYRRTYSGLHRYKIDNNVFIPDKNNIWNNIAKYANLNSYLGYRGNFSEENINFLSRQYNNEQELGIVNIKEEEKHSIETYKISDKYFWRLRIPYIGWLVFSNMGSCIYPLTCSQSIYLWMFVEDKDWKWDLMKNYYLDYYSNKYGIFKKEDLEKFNSYEELEKYYAK